MRKPKLRELKEAVRAAFSGRFTTKYPFEPHTPPDGFRGKPEFDEDECIGCGACAEVCPALAIKVIDSPDTVIQTNTASGNVSGDILCEPLACP